MASRGANPLLRLAAAVLNVLYPQLPIVRGEPNKVFPIIQQVGCSSVMNTVLVGVAGGGKGTWSQPFPPLCTQAVREGVRTTAGHVTR